MQSRCKSYGNDHIMQMFQKSNENIRESVARRQEFSSAVNATILLAVYPIRFKLMSEYRFGAVKLFTMSLKANSTQPYALIVVENCVLSMPLVGSCLAPFLRSIFNCKNFTCKNQQVECSNKNSQQV